MPIVDGIKWDSLEHTGYNGDTKSVGIFEWGFLYKEMRISDTDFSKKSRATEPNPYLNLIFIRNKIIKIFVSSLLTLTNCYICYVLTLII